MDELIVCKIARIHCSSILAIAASANPQLFPIHKRTLEKTHTNPVLNFKALAAVGKAVAGKTDKSETLATAA